MYATYAPAARSSRCPSVDRLRYVRDILLPTLTAGDILVMDNLSAHKDSQAIDLLKNAGVTVRFRPAYSPDLNSIELMWSKVKALLRKAEVRTNEALLLAIGDSLSMVTKKSHPLVCPLRLRLYLK